MLRNESPVGDDDIERPGDSELGWRPDTEPLSAVTSAEMV